MSAIASFYLIDNGDIARLKELATQPVGLVAGGKWHDPYDEFLVARARQLETYGWSGYVIGSEVYFYLESHSASLDDYCDQKLSAHFYEARQNSILVFRPHESRELVQHIETNWPDTTALRAFLDSPDMSSPTHEAAPVEAVFDGLAIMKSWLSQVDEGHVGLLTIG